MSDQQPADHQKHQNRQKFSKGSSADPIDISVDEMLRAIPGRILDQSAGLVQPSGLLDQIIHSPEVLSVLRIVKQLVGFLKQLLVRETRLSDLSLRPRVLLRPKNQPDLLLF